MKTCKNCKYFDHDPSEGGVGECIQQPEGPGAFKIVDAEDHCSRYRKVMPTLLTVHNDFYEMYEIHILEWNVETGMYESAFRSSRSWTNIDDAIDEAIDMNYEEAEYVALDKLAYPCQLNGENT